MTGRTDAPAVSDDTYNMNNRTETSKISTPARPSLEGISAASVALINKFNARPMRREDDCRVWGWEIIENNS